MITRFYVTCLLLCMSWMAVANDDAPDAKSLMEKNFFTSKISGMSGVVKMLLITDQGQERLRKLNMWSKLRPNGVDSEVLMRFDEPADVKGTGFLQIENSNSEDNIWVYLPALGKIRRLVANNKRDSFFGTDFSYGDVLLPSVSKYQHSYLRTESVGGVTCYVVESRPIDEKTRDESGYSRKLVWLDIDSYLERRVEYYDLDGALLKTQNTYEPKMIDPEHGRWVLMRREMVNHQTGHKTVYMFERVELEKGLADSYFSSRTLER